ncbi:roadblock/LC7 domain-containing protein [Streptomyces sp. NPDC004546]|uniref:roadblock/LC7 domain-containing protein n=1 Tax=Streptomyces sp. NPDC004546 TaxID=3154282 RepID=UPI0033A2E607
MTNPPTLAAPVTSAQGTPATPPSDLTPVEEVAWLLDDFVNRVPGVTYALIASKDGLTLLASSNMTKDWADTVSAALSGYASLAAGTPGPTGRKQPAKQIAVEFDDCLFMAMASGLRQRSAFSSRPETEQGAVETVLGVYTEASADGGLVGYEMSKLIKRFPQRMQTPVRQELAGASADSAHAGIR